MSSKKPDKTDWGLRFFRDVLGLEDLHFGLFDDEPHTVEGARKAQGRYTDELVGMIPEGVSTVLDVGCGTGTTAFKLKEKGYQVECVNPDAYQESIFHEKFQEKFHENFYEKSKEKPGGSIPFHRTTFELFQSDKKFDLVLMSESSQYIDTGEMVKNLDRVLVPGGWFLLADYFRKTDIPFYRTCKIKDVFMKKITAGGYELTETKDITEGVIPNLTLGMEIYEKYALPVITMGRDYLKSAFPKTSGIVMKVFAGKFKKISYYVFEHTPEKLDAKKFRDNMEYLFQLYRKKTEER
ncbi:MAG: class I SAM-dependent methyltransferase [Elusimicrobiota bacterium]